MKKRSLLTTNIFLKNPEIRDKYLIQTVLSSSAIEGVGVAARRALGMEQKRIDRIIRPAPDEEH
jgi:hypothetical protein